MLFRSAGNGGSGLRVPCRRESRGRWRKTPGAEDDARREDDVGMLELGDDVGRPVRGDEGKDEGGMGVGDEVPLPPPISLGI